MAQYMFHIIFVTDKFVDVSGYSRDSTGNTVQLDTQDIFADLIR